MSGYIPAEPEFNLTISDCCAVCTRSPFKGRRNNIGYCKRIGDYVSLISVCRMFDLDLQRKRKRIGGIRSSLSRMRNKE